MPMPRAANDQAMARVHTVAGLALRGAVVGLLLLAGGAVAAGGAIAGAPAKQPVSPQPPPRLDPLTKLDEAEPGKVYLNLSKVKGTMAEGPTDASNAGDRLRYTWALPKGFSREKPRDLVTLIHNTEQDVMWGHDNYPPGSLGDDLISVAIDGTTDRDDGTRVFAPRPTDIVIYRDFILEMTRTIPCRRIIHYGLAEGGMFATVFGGRFPALSMGIIAHNSGSAQISATKGGVLGVPIVLLAGTDDEQYRMARSLAAREAYEFDGHKMVFVHILPKWQDQPCPAAVRHGVDLCVGLATDDPEEALDRAERLMRPGETVRGKPVPPALHMARAVLKRVDLEPPPEQKRDPNIPGGGLRGAKSFPTAFKKLPPEVRQKAVAHAAVIEGWAQKALTPLRQRVGTAEKLRAAIRTDPKADNETQAKQLREAARTVGTLWLLREQLRGVDAMETLAADCKLDELLTERADAGDELVEKLAAQPPAAEAMAAISDALHGVAGYHSLPMDLAQQARKLTKATGVPAGAADALPLIEAVMEGFDQAVGDFATLMATWSK
jgi:hypothetical protein